MNATWLFILSLFFAINSYGQDGYYVDKDPRIRIHNEEIVRLLIEQKELNGTSKNYKNYAGQIYIRKQLELIDSKLLLVEFGSLGDHGRKFWGLLSTEKSILFAITLRNTYPEELLDFLEKYNLQTRKTIIVYIETRGKK